MIDSSFVPLPLIADLLLMELSSRHSLRMPYYAAMATVGSLLGCIWIYWIARKGGQAYSRKTQGHPPGRIRKYIQEYPMASVFLPAVAPFPVPFKPFVVAQGVFQVPFGTFVIGTLLGRGALFSSKHFWERATAWRRNNISWNRNGLHSRWRLASSSLFSWFADCSLFAGRNILKLIEVREPGVPVRA